jgi:hypothetical protein
VNVETRRNPFGHFQMTGAVTIAANWLVCLAGAGPEA